MDILQPQVATNLIYLNTKPPQYVDIIHSTSRGFKAGALEA